MQRSGLRHIQTVRKGGKTYRYARPPSGQRVRLPDLPEDHPDFLAAYLSALHQQPQKAGPLTLAQLIEAWLASDDYKRHGTLYRATLRRHADAIRAKAKDGLASDLRDRHIRADIADLTPSVSRHRLKAWRAICAWGYERGRLPGNPALMVKGKKQAKGGYPPWTAADIAAFRARHGPQTVARRCMEVLFWTGARISDAVALGPAMVDGDGILCFRQSKTGDMAYVPWSCPVPSFADASDRDAMLDALRHGPGGATFLATAQGQRSHKALGTLIAEAAREAGVEKSAHGLRKARAIALAERGATTHQIAAWTGHHTLAEVAHYTAESDRRKAVLG